MLLRWRPSALGALPSPAPRSPLGERELRIVSYNSWQLAQPARVPVLLEALRDLGEELSGERALPELVALQEIESEAVLEALRASLPPTHWMASSSCARRAGGGLRSAVALLGRHDVLALEDSACIELGRIWPDHPRCTIHARLRTQGGETLHAFGVHLAWHVANAPMAQRLRDAIDTRCGGERVVLLGDLNAFPNSRSYRILVSPPFRDLFAGSPPTHAIGARLDYVLVGPGLELVRPLARRRAFETLQPASGPLVPPAIRLGTPPRRPTSDHLPEGGVFRLH